jgi:hypothetical protein
MPNTVQAVYNQVVSTLSLDERLHLATLILNDLVRQNVCVVEYSDTWTEQDRLDLVDFSLQHSATLFSDTEEMVQ